MIGLIHDSITVTVYVTGSEKTRHIVRVHYYGYGRF